MPKPSWTACTAALSAEEQICLFLLGSWPVAKRIVQSLHELQDILIADKQGVVVRLPKLLLVASQNAELHVAINMHRVRVWPARRTLKVIDCLQVLADLKVHVLVLIEHCLKDLLLDRRTSLHTAHKCDRVDVD